MRMVPGAASRRYCSDKCAIEADAARNRLKYGKRDALQVKA